MTGDANEAAMARYSGVAVAFHWVIAALIIIDLIIGLDFAEPLPGQRFSVKPLLWLHISIGITVLVLSIARLAWRFWRRPPPHRADMKRWEVHASNLGHAAFYILMIGMPLSGWLIVSAHKTFPVKFMIWNLVELPMLPLFGALNVEEVAVWHHRFVVAHQVLAEYLLIALLALHVIAVIKHHLFDRDPIIWRMLPDWRSRRT